MDFHVCNALRIKPFQALLRNIPFFSLGEVGGAGAEPPQNLPTATAVVQTVLPLEWSRRKWEAGLSNPVPRFRRRNGNGKNPDGQGFKIGDFFAHFAKKYYSSLDGMDSRNGRRTRIAFRYWVWYNFPQYKPINRYLHENNADFELLRFPMYQKLILSGIKQN